MRVSTLNLLSPVVLGRELMRTQALVGWPLSAQADTWRVAVGELNPGTLEGALQLRQCLPVASRPFSLQVHDSVSVDAGCGREPLH